MARIGWESVVMQLLSILLTALAASGASSASKEPEFSRGQVWTYSTRSNESVSVLTVVEVNRPKGEVPIVFIGITGLHVRFRATPTGPYVQQTQLPCVPMSEDALRRSVKTLLRVDSQISKYLSDCSDFHLLGGPTYAVSVADTVAEIEKEMNR